MANHPDKAQYMQTMMTTIQDSTYYEDVEVINYLLARN